MDFFLRKPFALYDCLMRERRAIFIAFPTMLKDAVVPLLVVKGGILVSHSFLAFFGKKVF